MKAGPLWHYKIESQRVCVVCRNYYTYHHLFMPSSPLPMWDNTMTTTPHHPHELGMQKLPWETHHQYVPQSILILTKRQFKTCIIRPLGRKLYLNHHLFRQASPLSKTTRPLENSISPTKLNPKTLCVVCRKYYTYHHLSMPSSPLPVWDNTMTTTPHHPHELGMQKLP